MYIDIFVRPVLKNGEIGKWGLMACFAFAGRDHGPQMGGGYKGAIAPRKDIKYIDFLPSRDYDYEERHPEVKWEEVYRKYVNYLLDRSPDDIFLVCGGDPLSVFYEGVRADVTRLSGQEWVGWLELFRHLQLNLDIVYTITSLMDLGLTFDQANWASKVLPVSGAYIGEYQLPSVTGIYTRLTPRKSDTTPGYLASSGTYKVEWMYFCEELDKDRFQRPWDKHGGYWGVHEFFHNELYRTRVKDILKRRGPEERIVFPSQFKDIQEVYEFVVSIIPKVPTVKEVA